MKEEVFKIQHYLAGYRIDKQLLLSLDDIFKQYKNGYILELSIECDNNTGYVFENITECFETLDKKPYRIVKMEIKAQFGNKYDSNSIRMSFENSRYLTTSILFKFDNNDDYLLLKDKIEQCLKNFRLNYRVLSSIPIVPVLINIAFFGIYIYTNIHTIVYKIEIQVLICVIWVLGTVVCLLPAISRIKHNLFPFTEFRIGQNEMIEEKHSKIRGIIIVTVLFGIATGIVANLISNLLLAR